jgi:GNAT superfamily N-acetyltransferase
MSFEPSGGKFVLRPVRSDDFEALVTLGKASADTGRVQVAAHYVRNPVEAGAALRPDREWVVAEAAVGLIGAAQVSFGQAEIEGSLHPCACLSSLMVHPEHRRRGIAKALTRWRLDRAGPDAVVVAAIQTGNVGSLANATSWATQIFGSLTIPVFAVRRGAHVSKRLDIHEPGGDQEWEEAAAGLATFELGWNLRTPETAASLRERAERTLPSGERIQRYVLGVEGGHVVGGFELFEGAQLQVVVVERMPAALRALNLVVRVIPRDGRLREVSISRFWFADGRQDVGRALWSFARSAAAEVGNAVSTQFDPRSPLREVIRARPWTPKGHAAVAVRSPIPLSEERFLSPP